jgi:SNF2 family DNA or RNA helicase
MVKIKLKHSKLIIDGANEPSIFEWIHQSFFAMAIGFNVDIKNQTYTLDDPSALAKVLQESIKYLDDEGFELNLDQASKDLVGRLNTNFNDYLVALDKSNNLTREKNLTENPIGFSRQLKDYQLHGLEHLLAVKNGANFSVPGSGKTTVIYAAFQKLRADKIIEKLIVIGPRSSFQPWEDEAGMCIGKGLRIERISGSKTSRNRIYINSRVIDVLLCTYQTASNDEAEIISLCKKHNAFIVIDESHNIKNFEGGKWAEAMIRISQFARRRAILSGTPVPNNLTDLWSQITFLWPGEQVLGDRNSYRYRTEDKNEVGKIKSAVKPFIFRTTKKQLRLPRPKFNYHRCELKPYQSSIYRALSIKLLNDLKLEPSEKITLRQWRKAKIVRLIQAASNPSLLSKYSVEFDVPSLSGDGLSPVELIEKYPKFETPAKFELAIDITHKLLSENERVIIWTTFVFNIEMLKIALKDFNPLVVYGAIPKDASEDEEFNREQQIRRFKESTEPVVLIANPAACAESVSLHKICHNAVYLDRTFNCGQYLQSLDRIHRIGLNPDEIVTYHLLVANETIDDTIDRRLLEKEKNMLKILEDDLPIGSFETDSQQLGQTDDEEKIDFEETIKDIKAHLDNKIKDV